MATIRSASPHPSKDIEYAIANERDRVKYAERWDLLKIRLEKDRETRPVINKRWEDFKDFAVLWVLLTLFLGSVQLSCMPVS